MNEPRIEKRRRNLPRWTLDGSCYFITFHLADGQLSESERMLVLRHITSGDEKFDRLAAALIMPDHVHRLLRPLGDYSASRRA